MNLVGYLEFLNLFIPAMESAWRRYWRIIPSTRNINVAYVFVLLVLSSWLLLVSWSCIPSAVRTCKFSSTMSPEHPLGKYNSERFRLYEEMAAELDKQGPKFLGGGETSQSLKFTDLFTLKDGKVFPVHKEADPPVRATVLYLNPDASHKISRVVRKVLSAQFSRSGVWYQDPNLYHFSMYHASHHQNPVAATPKEVEAEAVAVKRVAKQSCPLEIELERVVLTPTGVVLGCWQVVNGTEPTILREELKKALPKSPAKQLVSAAITYCIALATKFWFPWLLQYNPSIFYSSFARLLGPPIQKDTTGEALDVLKTLVVELNMKLCSKATIKELWYVEELDILALALKGRTQLHRFELEGRSSN